MEGYLLITNEAPPPSEALQLAARITPDRFVKVGVNEYPTITCTHCHAVVVMNVARTRERAYCWNCDHYLCDRCGERSKTRACLPMAKILDERLTAAVRELVKG